jgi:hypothetical protein
MPESIIGKSESHLSPIKTAALIGAAGFFLAALANSSFSGPKAARMRSNFGACPITGATEDLQAAHLFHSKWPVGYSDEIHNGLALAPCAHSLQHWLMFNWESDLQFGMTPETDYGAALACLGMNGKQARKMSGADGYAFPFAAAELTAEQELEIALLDVSFLDRLKGVVLGRCGEVVGHFGHREGPNRLEETIPWNALDYRDLKPPVPVITRWREITSRQRVAEVKSVADVWQQNSTADWVRERFIHNLPPGNSRRHEAPNLPKLIASYQNTRRELGLPDKL